MFKRWGVAAIVALLAVRSGRAEEIEKKWRIALTVAGTSTTDQQQSPSANIRTLYSPNGTLDDFIYDPRNDSAAFSNFGINGGLGTVLSASYAFNRYWYVEGSAGYRQASVGNVEVQAEFVGAPIPNLQSFGFRIFNVDAGKMKQVPLQISAGIRFRPKAAFNPYLVAGVGYQFNSYSPSNGINELSYNMNHSIAGFARLSGTARGGESFASPTSFVNLSGVTVDSPNAPEFHFGGGVEITFKSKWAVVIDARYAVYSGKFHMMVNGSDQLGISVPADQIIEGQPGATGPFGSYLVSTGGLIDGGSLIPLPTAPAGTDCTVTPSNCTFKGPKDGIPDPGYYYVHAGSIRWDGATLNIGVKYTF